VAQDRVKGQTFVNTVMNETSGSVKGGQFLD
jgi:hypothetical protein